LLRIPAFSPIGLDEEATAGPPASSLVIKRFRRARTIRGYRAMGVAVPNHAWPGRDRPRERRALRLLAAIGAVVGGLCLVVATMELVVELGPRQHRVAGPIVLAVHGSRHDRPKKRRAGLIPPADVSSPEPQPGRTHRGKVHHHGGHKKHHWHSRGRKKHAKKKHCSFSALLACGAPIGD
jgi:hypothetical protein